MPQGIREGLLRLPYPACRPNARANVLGLKVRVIVLSNLIESDPFPYKLQDVLHGDARPGNTRLAKVDGGPHADTLVHEAMD